MAVELLSQVRFTSTSGDLADDIVNTWAWRVETSPPPAATLNDINTALEAFYTAIKGVVASTLYTGVSVHKIYNRADPKPRAPVVTYNKTYVFTDGAKAPPPEVSMCLSFQGARVSGQSQARRRGRVYLPTYATTAFNTNGTFATSSLTTTKDAADALLAASDAAADWTWVVWSPTSNASVPVSNGWVDAAPDIQRRRGWRSATRAIFS